MLPPADTIGLAIKEEVDPRHNMPSALDQGQLGSCFPAGTLIRMEDGSERAIEDIRLAECVVTAEGRTGMVRQTMVRLETSRLVKLSLWGYGALRMTAGHPVLTRRGYVRAGELQADDWVGLTRYEAPVVSGLVVADVLAKNERTIKRGRREMGTLPGRADVAVRVAALPDTVELTPRFGRLVGLFLAEGSTSSGKAIWTLGAHERETLVAETVDLLRDLGVEAYVQERPNNSINVVLYGTAWARLWERLCGTGAGEKALSPRLAGDPAFMRAVLDGWLAGDGYRRKSVGSSQRSIGTSVSRRLALAMYDIAQAQGLRPVLRAEKGKVNRHAAKRRIAYHVEVCAQSDNWRCEQERAHTWRRVRAVEQEEFAGHVYNLSVEGDESYVAEGIGVHNCTANATNRAFRYDTIMDGKDCGELSRLWTYYFERAIEHTLGQGDTGAEGHDAYTVAKHGIPAESLWPYDISKFEQKPPDVEPRAYMLTKAVHALLPGEDDFKRALSNGQTITYGFTVYRSFEEAWPETGIMPMPAAGEEVLGGHENLICGYLKQYPDHFLSLNSWGTGWGLSGYFLIPKRFVLDPQYASDYRTIVRPA
jgi:hypothetical protein